MKSIVFFNNKGGVGKTTLVYHFAYMLSEKGKKVLAVDLDPQANLSSMFLSEDRFYDIIDEQPKTKTIINAIEPLRTGESDIIEPHLEKINDNITLIVGDLDLSLFEDSLSKNWLAPGGESTRALRVTSSLYRIILNAGNKCEADYVLIDVGPNFGSLNRAILISADYLVVPTAADLFSIQGLKNLGKTLIEWKKDWKEYIGRVATVNFPLPKGETYPLGYVVMQHGVRESRPVQSYKNWANKIPDTYNKSILEQVTPEDTNIENDTNCIALLKHYHSLMPMAMTSKKPVFKLSPADGAIGNHQNAVKRAFQDFDTFAHNVLKKIGEL